MSRQMPLTPQERARRRAVVTRVGELLYGDTGWQASLAAALQETTGRTISRVAVAGYAAEGATGRPVPDWVMDNLQRTVAIEAPRIRAEAEAAYERTVSRATTAERVVNDAETALLLDEVIETVMGSLNEAESDA